MASLTPGILLKLLQSMNTDTKVAGEHRSVVLQVVGIVPALSGQDLWPSHGFYVQLSDSANSTYVSLSDRDADAILCNRPQLGHFVYLDRLHFEGSSVPRASGVRPIPGRPQSVVGNPEPLVVQVSPSRDGFVIQPASAFSGARGGPPPPPPPPLVTQHPQPTAKNSDDKGVHSTRTVFAARENVAPQKAQEDAAAAAAPPTKRRFSSPAPIKTSARKSGPGAPERDPSPAGKAASRPSSPALGRAASRSSSPVPSKCEVPSLVAAKEDNRKTAREPAIVVPSRYRQPSPVGGRKAASPMGRRNSISPGRRLSGVLKLSPMPGDGSSKKKISTVAIGITKVSDALMGSVKASRKSWDDSSSNIATSTEQKEKSGSKSKLDKQAILRTQIAMSRRLSDVNVEHSKDEDAPVNEKARANSNLESSPVKEKSSRVAPKITVHDRKWTDGSIPLDVLPDNLVKLGKEALQRRSIASTAAAEALEEASTTESIVRSLSMFSDLCSSSKTGGNLLPTIDRFLSIYQDVVKLVSVSESLVANRSLSAPRDSICGERYRSILLWVEAAMATDLEAVSLLSSGAGGGGGGGGGASSTKHKSSEKLSGSLQAVPEKLAPFSSEPPPRTSTISKKHGTPSKNATVRSAAAWSRGSGMVETLELVHGLRQEMQIWFLRFVEEAVVAGFPLMGGGGGGDSSGGDNARIAAVLSHLKRVNEWLDGVGQQPGQPIKGMIEQLKRKIYGFVIQHVGSAFDSSLSLSGS